MYTANPAVMQTDLGSELVLVNSASGHSFRLNETARAAWLSLPTTAPQLAGLLVAQFQVEQATALQDAEQVLQQLVAQGLVSQA